MFRWHTFFQLVSFMTDLSVLVELLSALSKMMMNIFADVSECVCVWRANNLCNISFGSSILCLFCAIHIETMCLAKSQSIQMGIFFYIRFGTWHNGIRELCTSTRICKRNEIRCWLFLFFCSSFSHLLRECCIEKSNKNFSKLYVKMWSEMKKWQEWICEKCWAIELLMVTEN